MTITYAMTASLLFIGLTMMLVDVSQRGQGDGSPGPLFRSRENRPPGPPWPRFQRRREA